jgi:undecaprenyl-phosphate 4-deoxy-4-formamido-L-arabinose transferase
VVSIIIPVYNGKSGLDALWKRLEPVLASMSCPGEVLFIDDCSTDGSLALIRKICAGSAAAGWASLAENRGQQAAVLCGLRLCRGDWAVTIDDDLQHPPELIPRLYEKAKGGGFDAVYAVPCGHTGTGARMRDLFFSSLLGKPSGMRIGSFRIFSREAVNHISRGGGRFVYISAELFRGDFRVSSFDYQFMQPLVPGPSRYGLVRRLWLYIRLVFWYNPAIRFIARRLGALRKQSYLISETGGILLFCTFSEAEKASSQQ